MDPALEKILNDPHLRQAWSLSFGGVAEGLATFAPPLLMLILVGTLTVTDGMTVIGLSLLVAVPLFLIAWSRLGSAPGALRKALVLAVFNLLGASVGYIIHALPNFFFA